MRRIGGQTKKKKNGIAVCKIGCTNTHKKKKRRNEEYTERYKYTGVCMCKSSAFTCSQLPPFFLLCPYPA